MIIAKHLFALSLAATVLGASSAMAQQTGQSTEPPSTFDRIEKSLSEAATQAMDYVQSFIPYKMPEVQPNGDIVIRRDKPAAEATPAGQSTTTPVTGTPSASTTPPEAPKN